MQEQIRRMTNKIKKISQIQDIDRRKDLEGYVEQCIGSSNWKIFQEIQLFFAFIDPMNFAQHTCEQIRLDRPLLFQMLQDCLAKI
jgi:hypothetical protein